MIPKGLVNSVWMPLALSRVQESSSNRSCSIGYSGGIFLPLAGCGDDKPDREFAIVQMNGCFPLI
ncbi:hypothetical protein OAF34_03365 [Pirellulaceae bacterium]|nr:hypothetical protein [Pirellulaceae bacterium]